MSLSTHHRLTTLPRPARPPLTAAQRADRGQQRLSALERSVAGELRRLRPHRRSVSTGLRERTDLVVERLKHLV